MFLPCQFSEISRQTPGSARVLAVLLFLPVSCGRPAEQCDAPPPSRLSAGAPSLTPAETVRHLRRHLAEGRLSEVESFLLPDQRSEVMALLRAVSAVAGANESLQSAARERIGRAAARRVDRSQVVNAVGVFSRDVTVIDERIDSDTAVVTIQIADRLPLEQVQLIRTSQGWQVRTDPPVPGLAGELRTFGRILLDLARMVRDTPLTAEVLDRELRLREAAVGRRITALLENTHLSHP